MESRTRKEPGSRGGAPETLRDVLARSFEVLLSRLTTDGCGSAEGTAADGGNEEERVSERESERRHAAAHQARARECRG